MINRIAIVLATCICLFFCVSPQAYADDTNRGQFYRTFLNAFGITVNADYDDAALAAEIDPFFSDVLGDIDAITSPIDWKWLSEQSYYPTLTNYIRILYASNDVDTHNGMQGLYWFTESFSQVNSSLYPNVQTEFFGVTGTNKPIYANPGVGSNPVFHEYVVSYPTWTSFSPNSFHVDGMRRFGSEAGYSIVKIMNLANSHTYFTPHTYSGYSKNIMTYNNDGDLTTLAGAIYVGEDGYFKVDLMRWRDVSYYWLHGFSYTYNLTYLGAPVFCYRPSNIAEGGFYPYLIDPGAITIIDDLYTEEEIERIYVDYVELHADEPADLNAVLKYMSQYVNIDFNKLGGYKSKSSSGANNDLNYGMAGWGFGVRDYNGGYSLSYYTSIIYVVDKIEAYMLTNSDQDNTQIEIVATRIATGWDIKEWLPSEVPKYVISCNYELGKWYENLTAGEVVVLSRNVELIVSDIDELSTYGATEFIDSLGGTIVNYVECSLALKSGGFDSTLRYDDPVIAGGGDGGTVGDAYQDGRIGSGVGARPEFARYFPFSLPWDISDLLRIFVASPRAPVIDFPLASPDGSIKYFHIDFSSYSTLSTLIRTLLSIVFLISLVRLYMSITGIASGD
ncbi:MAG: hypothetical protein LBC35_06215 [Coriobacteriales bacterium]|jgi:hypothetical protein|nr:hypothetical protein [Coriobacteriales bacterium]